MRPELDPLSLPDRSLARPATADDDSGGISRVEVGSVSDQGWIIHDAGQQYGPHSQTEIAAMLAAGSVSRAALARREGIPTGFQC